MLGIGAAHQLDPNGIAWKQNKDFENLLKRLNGDAEASVVEGFKKADSDETDSVGQERNGVQDEAKKEKKRKRKDDSKDSPTKKKNFEKGDDEETRANESIYLHSERETGPSERRRTVPTLPRHRAYAFLVVYFLFLIYPVFLRHRARAIAAKNLSSKSAAHISEILGIPPTPSSLSSTATPSGLASGTDTPQVIESHEIERITTSTKTVHDYFKEKLKSKKTSTFVDPLERDLSYDTPRGGLGSTSRTSFGSSIPSSTFLAAASQSIPSAARSHTEVAVGERVAAPDMENKVKKKRSKVNRPVVSDDDTVDVSKRTIERGDKSKNSTAAADNLLANLTSKKKIGKRKKEQHIRD